MSWSHSACFTVLGSGTASWHRLLPSSSEGRYFSGNVTTLRVDTDLPDHTVSQARLNDCRMRALTKLSSSKTQFNVAAREAKDTIGALKDFSLKGYHGLKNMAYELFQRQPKDPRRFQPPYQWREVPGDYLGYLYGLRPLADDIANGFDQLSGLSKQNMSFGYSTRAKFKEERPFQGLVSTPGYLQGNGYVALGCTRKSFARVRYDYAFPKWWIDNVPVLTPFSEAWELTRMSFVLDWVLPVGNWIESVQAAQFDPYFQGGVEIYGTDEDWRGPFSAAPPVSPYWEMVMSNPSFHCRKFGYVRTALKSTDRPVGRLEFPSFRNYLDVSNAAQALSLLTQAFKTPPSRWL